MGSGDRNCDFWHHHHYYWSRHLYRSGSGANRATLADDWLRNDVFSYRGAHGRSLHCHRDHEETRDGSNSRAARTHVPHRATRHRDCDSTDGATAHCPCLVSNFVSTVVRDFALVWRLVTAVLRNTRLSFGELLACTQHSTQWEPIVITIVSITIVFAIPPRAPC